MTKHYKYSRRIHFATLCCFLLPFFHFTGCSGIGFGPSQKEIDAKNAEIKQHIADSIACVEAAAKEQETADSIALVKGTKLIKVDTIRKNSSVLKNSTDTVKSNSISQVNTSDQQTTSLQPDTVSAKPDKEERFSQTIANKYPFIRPLLIPKVDTYTGVAIAIDAIPSIFVYGMLFISIIFLILSLVIKFIDVNARKTIALLDILAFLLLYFSQLYMWCYETLWGFWFCLTFVFVLTIYDLCIIILNKRFTNKPHELNI